MPRKPTNRTVKKGPERGRPPKDWKIRFLASLAKTLNVTASATKAGVSRSQAYDHRNADPEFAAAWDDALATATDNAEEEMFRRAVKGTLKPVYQNGKKVGTIREYSDTLLIFLLKGRRSAVYGDRSKHELSGPNGGPLPLAFEEAARDIYGDRDQPAESGPSEE